MGFLVDVHRKRRLQAAAAAKRGNCLFWLKSCVSMAYKNRRPNFNFISCLFSRYEWRVLPVKTNRNSNQRAEQKSNEKRWITLFAYDEWVMCALLYIYYTLLWCVGGGTRGSLFTPTSMQINPKLQHGGQTNLKCNSMKCSLKAKWKMNFN